MPSFRALKLQDNHLCGLPADCLCPKIYFISKTIEFIARNVILYNKL